MAVGTLVGSVALRPNTPLTAMVIGTLVIVTVALLVDWLYARGWLPGSLVHAKPILLYADGKPQQRVAVSYHCDVAEVLW